MDEVTVTSLANLQNEVRDGDGRTFVLDEPEGIGDEGAIEVEKIIWLNRLS